MIAHFQQEAIYEAMKYQYYWYLVINAVVFLALVGLLWYVVGLEIGGGGSSTILAKTRFRPIFDVLAIGFGIVLFRYADSGMEAGYYYGTGVGFIRLLWIVAIIAFYGHDLWVTVRSRASSDKSSAV